MLFNIIALCLCCMAVGDGQRCSYVTVPICESDVTITPGTLMSPNGTKGDQGQPGATGNPGNVGPKGEPGVAGAKGEEGDVGPINEQAVAKVWNKLRDLEKSLTTNTSCAKSPVNGKQKLRGGLEAYCEDGWTVFQRRFNGSVDFNRYWNEYTNGFGSLGGEFWLGLEKLHKQTAARQCRLKVDLTDFNENQAFAEYSSFSVENAGNKFRLRIAGYSGTAGDSMMHSASSLNEMYFSTKDRDHDRGAGSCADSWKAGWWFNDCSRTDLNAPWGRSTGAWSKIFWFTWKGNRESLKATTMKFRCD